MIRILAFVLVLGLCGCGTAGVAAATWIAAGTGVAGVGLMGIQLHEAQPTTGDAHVQ